jgi:hypothetical protein
MKFDPIDWNAYNKPPFLPQWLSRGETKKFVSFDDSQLMEIEGEIYKLSDQHDIEKAKGVLLDRIGKIVSEPREGNDDALYRLLIKLRILLNTTDGSVNDIIKVIKFIYSSEVVHITPNYPAAITILHDGETANVDFNKIIAQVIGAGIGYDTRELFYFIENMIMQERDEKTLHKEDAEMFCDTIFRNGRVLRDGTTVFDTEEAELYRNGAVSRDGSVEERNGWYRKPAVGRIRTPIFRRSGIEDTLALVYGDRFIEEWQSYVQRNGAFLRDGTLTRDGKAPVSMNDVLEFDRALAGHRDTFPVQDTQEKAVVRRDTDTIGHGYVRNGSYNRDGSIYRTPDRVIDVMEMRMAEPPIFDTARASITRTGFVLRDGRYNRSGFAGETILDDFVVGKKFNYRRNGQYIRDGSIYRNGDTFIPLG